MKRNHFLVSFLFLHQLLVQQISSENVNITWDLLASDLNAKRLLFFNASGVKTHEELVPFPSSGTKHYNIFDEQTWNRQTIKAIVVNTEKDLVYLSSTYSRRFEYSIVSFNLRNKTSQLIYKGSGGTVDGIALYNGSLYWLDNNGRVNNHFIYKIREQLTNESHNEDPEVVYTSHLPNCKLGSLTSTPKTTSSGGGLYWYALCHPSSSIYHYRDSVTQKIITGVGDVESVVVSADHAYWIEYTSYASIQVIIKRTPIKGGTIEVIYTGYSTKSPNSLTMFDSALYWTTLERDTVSKLNLISESNRVEVFTPERSRTLNAIFSKNISMNLTSHNANSPRSITNTNKTLTTVPLTRSSTISSVAASILPSESVKPDNCTCLNPTLNLCPKQESKKICLNSGICVVFDNKEYCLCKDEWKGPNCGEEVHLSGDLIITELPSPLSKDEHKGPKLGEETHIPDEGANTTLLLYIIVSSLTFLVVILLLIIIILLVKYRRVDLHPRIRRKLIVSRAPSAGGQCEMVDIENCCNMNICETPCHERASSVNQSQISCHAKNSCPEFPEIDDKEKLIDF